ncbi:Penicillin-binding protein 2D [compost metagenome]
MASSNQRKLRLGVLALVLMATWMPLPAEAGMGTEVLDWKGRRIALVRGTAKQKDVPLRTIPEITRQAVVAIEDSRFYSHFGVDIRGTARALVTNLQEGRAAEGGSTITQQVARILYLNQEKSLQRKVNEAMFALKLEREYSKDQILEIYLNRAYWGHGAEGIEAAAQTYFGKSCKTLTLAESALLAGLLQRPEGLTPLRNPDAAKKRQHIVLDRMAELKVISKADADRAKRTKLRFAPSPDRSQEAPYFTAYLINQLTNRYGDDAIFRGDLKVWTTLDLDMQKHAEKLIANLVKTQGTRYQFDQAALVALDPRSGYIRAMVGGADYQKSQFNRAVQAKRQPGSTFKPFVYLTAFERGISPEATASDAVISYPQAGGKPWTPRNYDNEKLGVVSLRKALEHSNNVITVKLLKDVGTVAVIDKAHRFGISTPLTTDLTLGLGTSVVSPLELTSAYGVMAADGMKAEPISYFRITDAKGRVIEDVRPQAYRVTDETSVRQVNDVLQGVITRGTAKRAAIGRPAAGKTGTTNDYRDAWFVGYVPQLVTSIWIGNDNNTVTKRATGGAVCAPVWATFMKSALSSEPPMAFPLPQAPAPSPEFQGLDASESEPGAIPASDSEVAPPVAPISE